MKNLKLLGVGGVANYLGFDDVINNVSTAVQSTMDAGVSVANSVSAAVTPPAGEGATGHPLVDTIFNVVVKPALSLLLTYLIAKWDRKRAEKAGK